MQIKRGYVWLDDGTKEPLYDYPELIETDKQQADAERARELNGDEPDYDDLAFGEEPDADPEQGPEDVRGGYDSFDQLARELNNDEQR